MVKKMLLTAVAAATIATGTIAGTTDADAGFNITIGSYGHGYGYGTSWYGPGHRNRNGYRRGYNSSGYYGGPRHDYRPRRRHCRWKVKKQRVRYWDDYRNCWVTKKINRRYRSCY